VDHGHIVDAVRKSIRAGVSPIQAIQFVTNNAPQLLRRGGYFGSIAPSRVADILVLSDLSRVTIDQVWCDGQLVAGDGHLVIQLPEFEYPPALATVHLKPVEASLFKIPAKGRRRR
jgi:adenine deaminase